MKGLWKKMTGILSRKKNKEGKLKLTVERDDDGWVRNVSYTDNGMPLTKNQRKIVKKMKISPPEIIEDEYGCAVGIEIAKKAEDQKGKRTKENERSI